jgi:inorganic triphosphatase YgiF
MAGRADKRALKAGTSIEAELRLAGEPDVLKAVFDSPFLALEGDRSETLQDLESCYFDTPDQDLRARGLAYRVRSNGKGYVQTLKAGDTAQGALTKRGEWEIMLDDARPKPAALPKAARTRLPTSAIKNGLQQAFKTSVQRRTREIGIMDGERLAGRVEVALDLGEIETRAGDLAVSEIELELIDGQPEALYKLALDLQEFGRLHLETRSKSTRAFHQLADEPPSWQRATTPALRSAQTVDDAMIAIFENCFEQWLANQAAAIDGRDPEGVHQMRVALRRLRSALSVFREMIPEDQLLWLKGSAREALGALGPARDWDVFHDELLAPLLQARPEDAALIALRHRARARGRGGYKKARAHLRGPDYTRFVLLFGHWLETRAWRKDGDTKRAEMRNVSISDFAIRLLNKRHKLALKKGRGFAELSPDRRHELRIALKKLRYAIEFVEPLFERKAVKSFVRRVKALQEDLGHLNDVTVAETLLHDLLSRPGKQDLRLAAGQVIGWYSRGLVTAEPDLRRSWKVLAKTPPFWA